MTQSRAALCGALAISCFTLMLAPGRALAQARHYQPFRVDTGVSGTFISGLGRGGFGAVVEPKFVATDHIDVGARVEGAVMFGGSVDGAGNSVSMDMAAAAAVLAKGEYLFTTGGARPFLGLGLGMYDIGSQSVGAAGGGSTSIDQKAGRYFGVAPEVGVDLGRLRLAATYNLMLGADLEVHQTVGGTAQTASYSQNYFTFEMSFRFGGSPVASPAGQAVQVAAR